MIVKWTNNTDDIRSILCHPDIYRCIAGDNCPSPDEFVIPLSGVKYHGCYLNNEIIGVMVYHVDGGKLWCHFQVLPEFRKDYALEFGKITLSEQLKRVDSIFAEIPICYQNVLRFAYISGFNEVGISDDPYVKDGKEYEVKILRCDNGFCK